MLMGVLTPPEQAPLEQAAPEQAAPEQAPLELTTDEAMFRAFGPLSDEDDEENEGTRLMRRRRTGVSTRTGLSRTGVSTRMGPSIGSYF
jgi:hypothetical protein